MKGEKDSRSLYINLAVNVQKACTGFKILSCFNFADLPSSLRQNKRTVLLFTHFTKYLVFRDKETVYDETTVVVTRI